METIPPSVEPKMIEPVITGEHRLSSPRPDSAVLSTISHSTHHGTWPTAPSTTNPSTDGRSTARMSKAEEAALERAQAQLQLSSSFEAGPSSTTPLPPALQGAHAEDAGSVEAHVQLPPIYNPQWRPAV